MVKKEIKKREGCCKSFFKFTIAKIIIFIIIFIILLILIKPRSVCANCVDCPCSLTFINLLSHNTIQGISVESNMSESLVYLAYLIEIIIAYILSCLILLIYKKIKGEIK